MTDDQKKKLEQQLWNIANELRGKMNADEFRDYCLGFIFFKYLSEKLHQYANTILSEDAIDFTDIDESSEEGQDMLAAIKEESVAQLGDFMHFKNGVNADKSQNVGWAKAFFVPIFGGKVISCSPLGNVD